MTREEVKDFILLIKSTYPKFEFQGEPTINAWLRYFKDVEKEKAENALDKYVMGDGKYAPTPNTILKLIAKDRPIEGFFHTLMKDNLTGNHFIYSKFPDGTEKRTVCHQLRDGTWKDEEGYLWDYPEVKK